MATAVALTLSMEQQAEERMRDAHHALRFARDAFSGFPSDLTREGVVEAETAFEDSLAVYGEWSA